MQIIDLSVLVQNSPSEPLQMKVTRLSHEKGASHFCRQVLWDHRLPFFKRVKKLIQSFITNKRLKPKHFPDGKFLTLDTVTLATHMGTHIDAPIHYGPICENKKARTIDQLPLEWFFAESVRLDMRHKLPREFISVKDIQDALAKISYSLKPNTIVLIWTGADRKWGTREYFSEAPGMSREAIEWLIQNEVKIIGIDTYGMDRPIPAMIDDFFKTKDKSYLWPAHFCGRDMEYLHLERLTNLDQLPCKGFKIACFPIKLCGLDASWVRAVGIIEGEESARRIHRE